MANAQVQLVSPDYWGGQVVHAGDTVELVRVLHSPSSSSSMLAMTVSSSTGLLSFSNSSTEYHTEELFFWLVHVSLEEPARSLFVTADLSRVLSIQHPQVVTEHVTSVPPAELASLGRYYFKPPRVLGDLRDNTRLQPHQPLDPAHFLYYTTRVLVGNNSFRFNLQKVADVPLTFD